jgi:error-prone DNA polymerase
MLSALRKSFDLLARHYERPLTLASVPQDDPDVYAMIRRAETVGVFQIESRAQMASLPLLKPERWYDLVIQIAIIRPGPIQGDMVHPYRRRKNGEEPVEYPDERIREVLHKTLGVPLFQEQAMRLAIVAAGFTPGEADQLRRAMAAWRRTGNMEQFHTKLIDGMTANGYDAQFGERLYRMIQGFGQYGFPESHAASFARLAYASAWLKHHYPEVFTASLLNSQPMGFYQPSQLVRDARQNGVDVRPVDVNHSDWDCTLEPDASTTAGWPGLTNGKARSYNHRAIRSAADPATRPASRIPHPAARHPPLALRLGFRMVKGLSESQAARIIDCRSAGRFATFEDVAHRTGLGNAVLTKLSHADAFRSLSISRREASWHALQDRTPMPLFDSLRESDPPVVLPSMSSLAEVADDYSSTGLSLRNHPIAFLRDTLTIRGVTPAEGLPEYPADRWVSVAGLVMMRQRPSTAKGVTFVTLEDETGTINLIVWMNVWEKYRRIASQASVLLASGPLQRQDEVIHVVVHHLEDVSQMLQQLAIKSRDFR